MTTPPKVAGCDISLTSTGLAFNTGWCGTTGRDGITALPIETRTQTIREQADILLTRLATADLVLIEKFVLARGRAGAGGAGERAYLYYLVVDALIHQIGVPLVEVPQATLKIYATGNGQVKKDEVKDAVARRLPMFEIGRAHV